MKTKLLSLLIVIASFFCLTSCEGWPSSYSEQINFYVSADCNSAGMAKIEELFKRKGLLVGEKISVSVIVEYGASTETYKRALQDKVIEILNKSATIISNKEFHALGTGATETTYVAKTSQENEKIGMVTTDYGRPN